ncbi:hypothetical protein FHS63_003437 [Azospirillum doebereinerae]
MATAVGEDHLDEGEPDACGFVQDQGGAVTVLDVGAMNA